MKPISYARLHCPPSIVPHAVWLYLRFCLSLRDVEEFLAERGLDLSYETVRRWVAWFGPTYARRLRAMRLHPLRYLVPGRGLRLHRWSDDVPLARGLRRGRGVGRPAAAAPRQAGGPEVDAPPAPNVGLRTNGDRDRQAAVLRCRAPRDRYDQPTRDRRPAEQSRREFASAQTPTGTIVDTLQRTRIDPALPHRFRQHVQRPASPDLPPPPSVPPQRSFRSVERCSRSSMTVRGFVGFVRAGSEFVTTPEIGLARSHGSLP